MLDSRHSPIATPYNRKRPSRRRLRQCDRGTRLKTGRVEAERDRVEFYFTMFSLTSLGKGNRIFSRSFHVHRFWSYFSLTVRVVDTNDYLSVFECALSSLLGVISHRTRCVRRCNGRGDGRYNEMSRDGVQTLRHQDTSAPVPKCPDSAEVSLCR